MLVALLSEEELSRITIPEVDEDLLVVIKNGRDYSYVTTIVALKVYAYASDVVDWITRSFTVLVPLFCSSSRLASSSMAFNRCTFGPYS